MKKSVIISIAFLTAGLISNAQDIRYGRQSQQYTTTYYSPMLWGANGFRSVEEENRLMEQTLAELRRQREIEDMTPEERANLRKRHQIKQEIRNEAVEARSQKADSKQKKS